MTDLAVQGFSLQQPPPGFIADPYPWFAALRRLSPVHPLGDNAVLLTRYADVLAVYRSADVSSDKQVEFAPRLGAGSRSTSTTPPAWCSATRRCTPVCAAS
jgi:cytochrome P450